MSLSQRPYVGTWQLGRQKLVQHTPDALVYVNGDTSLPGCPKCNGRIDIQQFLTEVSVDAGTDPGSASASFSLSIPIHHHESFARDAKFLLRPGLEVHVYERGYFPVKGLYSNLAEPRVRVQTEEVLPSEVDVTTGDETPKGPVASVGDEEVELQGFHTYKRKKKITVVVIHETGGSALNGTEGTLMKKGLGVHYAVDGGAVYTFTNRSGEKIDPKTESLVHTPGVNKNSIGIEVLSAGMSKGKHTIAASWFVKPRYAIPSRSKCENAWKAAYWAAKDNGVPISFPAVQGGFYNFKTGGARVAKGIISHQSWGGHTDGNFEVCYMALRSGGQGPGTAHANAVKMATAAGLPKSGKRARMLGSTGQNAPGRPSVQLRDPKRTFAISGLKNLAKKQLGLVEGGEEDIESHGDADEDVDASLAGLQVTGVPSEPSLLEAADLQGLGIEDQLAYPYYHVFHGVVTQVSHSWSGGVNTVSINCSSMLHFWQYHTISTNASAFGARPKEGKLRASMVGHNFTGMHPYQILYSLHHDMVGAAGGVAWALSQKTNQKARSEVTKESLFSLNIRYWKRRFDTGMIKLRLHGASGELFNTAQAVFLSRLSGRRITRSILRKRFTDVTSRTSAGSGTGKGGLLEAAQTVGLFRNRKLEALRQAAKSKPTGKNSPKYEINLTEMHAFVSNVSNWGQVNLFESSYESKLDIAQKVMQVTGFEFFQDVDGDFVFKPPMYNLDTSSSRVYRIEDIDIISASFEEKEPEATYCTVKNSWGKNIEVGVEGEWGHRGQYIDYRLVAQFGWRPHDHETAYFNDPKSLFFSAVNRLDILNAPINSASVTIPLRPEIRPGYPFYIPYLDAHYYCNSFSHSYSNGGQCSTSLQLIAKRAKFFAPGDPNKRGIDAIDLSNTVLPERPLEVLDEAGLPRLAGFPNVVLALDPDNINPLFFVVGADIENIDNIQTLKELFKRAKKLRILQFDSVKNLYYHTLPATTDEKDQEQEAKIVYFGLQDGSNQGYRDDGGSKKGGKKRGKKGKKSKAEGPLAGSAENPVDLGVAAARYVERKSTWLKTVLKTKNKAVQKYQDQLTEAEAEIVSIVESLKEKADSGRLKRELKKAQAEAKQAEGKLAVAVSRIRNAQESMQQYLTEGDESGIAHLLFMIKEVGEAFLGSNPNFRNLNSTINLLDMLSDKKATFSTGTQPGSYRYYSASHPDPLHQGRNDVKWVASEEDTPEMKQSNSFLDPIWEGQPVEGFVKKGITAPWPGAAIPEAKLGDVQVKRGIRVLTSNPTAPKGESLPTSEIRELMFTIQRTTFFLDGTSHEYPARVSDLNSSVLKALTLRFSPKGASVGRMPKDLREWSLKDLYDKKVWDPQNTFVQLAVASAREVMQADSRNILWPNFEPIVFPDKLVIQVKTKDKVGPVEISTEVKLQDGLFKDNPEGVEEFFPGSAEINMIDVVKRGGVELARSFFAQLNVSRRNWVDNLKRAGFRIERKGKGKKKKKTKKPGINKGLKAFHTSLSAQWGKAVGGTAKRGKTSYPVKTKDKQFYSPVFPVSDARGYEVIGSYRYGRGVSIEPGNIWRSLAFQDPLRFLDKHTSELVVDAFVHLRPPTVQIPVLDGKTGKPKVDKKGKVVTIHVKGETAKKEIEKRVWEQLRRNLSDSQILNLFPLAESLDQLKFSLSNYFADKAKEGIQKLPIINAALSLADLDYHSEQQICSCKAAEANLLLDAFSQQNFVQFVPSGDPSLQNQGFNSEGMDPATKWLSAVTTLSSAQWQQSQQALRGEVLERGGSSLLQSVRDFKEAITDGRDKALKQATAELEQAKQRVLSGAESIGSAFEDSEG